MAKRKTTAELKAEHAAAFDGWRERKDNARARQAAHDRVTTRAIAGAVKAATKARKGAAKKANRG